MQDVSKLTQKPPAKPGLNSFRGASFRLYGRKYKLFRRAAGGPFYIRIQVRGQMHKKSMEADEETLAIRRAKEFIESLHSGCYTRPQPAPSTTLARVLELYPSISEAAPLTVRNNISSLRLIVRTVLDTDQPDDIPLASINGLLAARFQRRLCDHYCRALPAKDEGALREARERAARSSRSLIQQARGVFWGRRGRLVPQYAAAGIPFAPGIQEFVTCQLDGRLARKEHLRPPDEVIRRAFVEIVPIEKTDPHLFIAFWLAVGAGLRRKEIQRMRWEYLIERDGALWVSGGVGKDGQRIEVPVQRRAVEALAPLRKSEGPVLDGEKGLKWAKRLNFWMRHLGWQTEKKMHELRAYVGSKIYEQSPLAAMKFLRHKSIRVTEEFYCRYVKTAAPVDVL